ncbi:MAG TPA: cytochrome c-type biogenesis CcmF C-terminal domain-containing protein [Candidatus Limnocylindrales bacterium]|nr:cytochrome c-type biogenesis CcmF C-terminal domain-containing protein [Candidatus Limnocylindrales bacterium]
MIPTLGHAAVVVGLAATLFAAAAFVLGARRRDGALVMLGRRAMYAAFALAALASLAMIVSLLTHDFSVRYVVRNNATTTPPFYSVISLWAALEGSILFWTLLATGWAALALHRFRNRLPVLLPWVGLVLALGAAFFFAVMIWPGDPFVRTTPVAAQGNGPNALLQNHPFMGLHPPLLYLGYTGMAIPFAFGMAALVTRRTDEAWLGVVRRWTLVPWIFLTAGIVAGAWWSYEVLGWGGYWAWDPVENAALLPWLTATAFIHSSMVAERRGTLRVWTHALVIATFVLTLVGTFLTRSGVVQSVHSFTASAIGPWFAAAILVTLAASLALLLWRLPVLGDTRPPGRAISREGAFLFNNVLFLAVTFAVLFGTLYPVIREATSGERVSLGAPWFNQVNAPIFVALLFLMGVGPALPWGGAGWRTLRDRFAVPVIAGSLLLVGGWLLGLRQATPLAALWMAGFVVVIMGDEVVRGGRARARSRGEGVALATWRLATRNRRRYGGYAVHVGIAVMAVAVAISATAGSDTTATLRPGESMQLGAYTITNRQLVAEPLAADPRVFETRAELTLAGPQSGSLAPALRDYPNTATLIATPAVRTAAGEDLYVTLLGADPMTGEVTLHVFVNPLVVWIWVGGGIAAAGGVFAAWPDRRRLVAAAPQGAEAGAASLPAAGGAEQ